MKLENVLMDVNSSFGAQFGVAVRDITPPIGIYSRNWGAAAFDQAVAVHQPLLMQCLCFFNEKEQMVLLTADLGWWKNAEDEYKIRKEILRHFNLAESEFIFALSHTHAGPSICAADAEQPGGKLIPPYLDFIAAQAIQCIEEAMNNRFEGRMNWTYGVCDLACNRDLQVAKDFLIGFNPLGVADDTLLVGQVFDSDDHLRTVICNYACHPTSFGHENNLISPDFVGEMRNTVEKVTGVPCVFLQGASGDLAPKKQYVADSAVVEANGRQLGYAVLSTLAQASKPDRTWVFDKALISGAPLACWKDSEAEVSAELLSRVVNIRVPYKKLPSPKSILDEYQNCQDRVLKDRLWRKYNTRKSIGNNQHANLPVWFWKLGNTIVVAQPNEAYSAFQMAVRAAFPRCSLVFINIANGYVGYLAPKELYDKEIYAVWQSPYDRGSLEILIEYTKIEIAKLLTNEA